jgi:hypothetical protein
VLSAELAELAALKFRLPDQNRVLLPVCTIDSSCSCSTSDSSCSTSDSSCSCNPCILIPPHHVANVQCLSAHPGCVLVCIQLVLPAVSAAAVGYIGYVSHSVYLAAMMSCSSHETELASQMLTQQLIEQQLQHHTCVHSKEQQQLPHVRPLIIMLPIKP